MTSNLSDESCVNQAILRSNFRNKPLTPAQFSHSELFNDLLQGTFPDLISSAFNSRMRSHQCMTQARTLY